jgi:hypothetical protein
MTERVKNFIVWLLSTVACLSLIWVTREYTEGCIFFTKVKKFDMDEWVVSTIVLTLWVIAWRLLKRGYEMKKWVPVLLALAIGGTGLIFLYARYDYRKSTPRHQRMSTRHWQLTIMDDMNELNKIMNMIDESCGITGFDQHETPINFLNVGKFVGSEVGGMHLAHPEKWEGPYLYWQREYSSYSSRGNLMLDGVEYEIVHEENGYFIIANVQLPAAMRSNDEDLRVPLNISLQTTNAPAELVEEDDNQQN